MAGPEPGRALFKDRQAGEGDTVSPTPLCAPVKVAGIHTWESPQHAPTSFQTAF